MKISLEHLFLGTVLFLVAPGIASAQPAVVLADFTFESDTHGAVPAGWTSSANSFHAFQNPYENGSNLSDMTGHWLVFDSADSALVDLTGYTTGFTFTLSFDLMDLSATDQHGVLIGYGHQASAADDWRIGPSVPDNWRGGGHLFNDLSATGVWEHFSFDFTPAIDDYLAANPGGEAGFRLFVDQWSDRNPYDYAYIDNIRLEATAVPEPSTALPAVLGLGILLFARRRHGASSLARRRCYFTLGSRRRARSSSRLAAASSPSARSTRPSRKWATASWPSSAIARSRCPRAVFGSEGFFL